MMLMTMMYTHSGSYENHPETIHKIIKCLPKKMRRDLQQKNNGIGFSNYDLQDAITDPYVTGKPTDAFMRARCFEHEQKCWSRSTKDGALWYQVDNQKKHNSKGAAWIPDDEKNTASITHAVYYTKMPLYWKKSVEEPWVDPISCDTDKECEAVNKAVDQDGEKKCNDVKGLYATCNLNGYNECGCYGKVDDSKTICWKKASGLVDSSEMD